MKEKLIKQFTDEEKKEYRHQSYIKHREARLKYRKEYYQKHKDEEKKKANKRYRIKCGLGT